MLRKILIRIEIALFIIAIFLACIVVAILNVLPAHGINVIFNSTGDSMLPTLPDNVLILTDQTPFEELEVGDIIVFRIQADIGQFTIHNWKAGSSAPAQTASPLLVYDEDAVFTDENVRYQGDNCIHRIVRINENGDRSLITKGDNCDGIDPMPVMKSGYIEKVFWYRNNLGWPLQVLFIKNGFLWYLSFFAVFTIFCFLCLVLPSNRASDSTAS